MSSQEERKARKNRTFLITGTSRGIGLELTRVMLERGYTVIATARYPEKSEGLRKLREKYGAGNQLTLEVLDVTSEESCAALADRLQSRNVKINGIFNNAGVMFEHTAPVEKVDVDKMLEEYQTNALGPLRVTRALLPLMPLDPFPIIANMSTFWGSIEKLPETLAGCPAFGYRMSKAALNMFNMILKETHKDHCCVVLDPSWVQTELGNSGGRHAWITAEESATGLVNVLDSLKKEDSGRFINYKGEPVPW